MPNTPRTKQGGSLKNRIDRAARATADQREARRHRESLRESSSSRSSSSRRSESRRADGRTSSSRSRSRDYERGSGKSQASEAAKQVAAGAADAAKSAAGNVASTVASGASSAVERVAPTTGKRIVLVVVIVIVLAVAILYPVGRTYYQSIRDGQRVEAQVAAMKEYNDAISAENDKLNTDEGVEAEARSEYGWVEQGEGSALVTNAGDKGSGSKLPAQPDIESIKAPQTWYYSLLNAIFFVSE